MEKLSLNVEKREQFGKGGARGLRRGGYTPCVIYSGGSSLPIRVAAKELSQFMNKTGGEQVLVNLAFADGARLAIMKDYQIDPVDGVLLHVDFQEISATKELKIMVHVITSGEPIGVRRDKGILQAGIREIEIQCLPDKIPGHITVDVSNLLIGQSIHVRDLKLGEGIKVLTEPHASIALVTTLKEEVEAPVEAAAAEAVAEPEVIKKGKKTEEAPAKEKA